MNDLPARTWYRWWLEWPKWFRIGCWAAVGVVILNAALAVRIYFGLQESSEIAALRERGATVTYFWEDQTWRHPALDTALAGLYGRSWFSIVELQLDYRATEADMQRISGRCQSLKRLHLANADVTATSIGELGRCRRLETLDLRKTDTDNAAVLKFADLKQLKWLYLEQTLVTDRVLPTLNQLPQLTLVNVHYTDVTKAGLQEWRAGQTRPWPVIASERDQYPTDPALGVICWSDGSRSSGFHGPYAVTKEGPLDSKKPSRRTQSGWGELSRNNLWWGPGRLDTRGDGDYRFTMKLGDYQSEPVIASAKDHTLSSHTIEFRMPCTKADALGAE